jgi:hypothetical protein
MEGIALPAESEAVATTQWVSGLLGSSAPPAMPDRVASRITEALAAEAVSRRSSSHAGQRQRHVSTRARVAGRRQRSAVGAC